MLSHSELVDIAATVYKPTWSGVAAGNVDYALLPRGGEMVVAFAGTHPQAALDWLRDARFAPIAVAGLGLVHAGFGDGARAAWDRMSPELGRRHEIVTFVGHSLGGALAVCAAALHAHDRPGVAFRLVTFGQPRVAFLNRSFHNLIAQAKEAAIYSGAGDIVPTMPFRPFYTHGARAIPLGSEISDILQAHSLVRYAADLKALGR